jgi:hypothetical protein
MVKSLGDFNKKQSSSNDLKNIKWSIKNIESQRTKKKKKENTSSTNIIYTDIETKPVKKTFVVEENDNTKSNKSTRKKHEYSSVKNSKIEQGWERKAR